MHISTQMYGYGGAYVTACNVLPLLEVILVCLQFGLNRVPGRFFTGVQGHLHLCGLLCRNDFLWRNGTRRTFSS